MAGCGAVSDASGVAPGGSVTMQPVAVANLGVFTTKPTVRNTNTVVSETKLVVSEPKKGFSETKLTVFGPNQAVSATKKPVPVRFVP